jgi:hypothetical protein
MKAKAQRERVDQTPDKPQDIGSNSNFGALLCRRSAAAHAEVSRFPGLSIGCGWLSAAGFQHSHAPYQNENAGFHRRVNLCFSFFEQKQTEETKRKRHAANRIDPQTRFSPSKSQRFNKDRRMFLRSFSTDSRASHSCAIRRREVDFRLSGQGRDGPAGTIPRALVLRAVRGSGSPSYAGAS